jgi:hypothetical protein
MKLIAPYECECSAMPFGYCALQISSHRSNVQCNEHLIVGLTMLNFARC